MQIAIDFRVKHGFICSYLEEHNMTIKQLAEEIGINKSMLGLIINLHYPLPKSGGSLDKLVKYFGLPAEVLFPEEYREIVSKKINMKHRLYKEIDMVSLENLNRREIIYEPDYEEDHLCDRIENALTTLSSDHQDILKRRFGIGFPPHTLTEIAKIYGKSQERIRQQEAKALRMLQHRKRRYMLLTEEEISDLEEKIQKESERASKCGLRDIPYYNSQKERCNCCKHFTLDASTRRERRRNYCTLNNFSVYPKSEVCNDFEEMK